MLHGGVAILVHRHLHAEEVYHQLINLEAVTVRFEDNLHITSAYLPPSATLLNADLDQCLNLSPQSLIVGDLSSKHTA